MRERAVHDLVIIGAGGHGRETLDVVEAINARKPTWRVVGLVDDGDVDGPRLERRGLDVVDREGLDPALVSYVIGIGDGSVRQEIDRQMSAAGFAASTLVHPRATVGGDVRLADGVILAAGASVTTNVSLGRHTQLNVGAVVSHDCVLGDFVTVSPGVLVNGECTIGDRVLLGTGAIITPRIEVGANATVGAGAVVLEDVEAGTTVVGAPARPV